MAQEKESDGMKNFYSDKKILIAGGAGLIGQALIRALVPTGAHITATEFHQRKIDPAWRGSIDVVSGIDLNRPKWAPNDYWAEVLKRTNIYQGFDIVFWAAAMVGGAKMIRESPMALVHYNLELAARNIQAAVEAGVGRFCYVSSSYVYPQLFDVGGSQEWDTNKADVPLEHYGLGWIKRFIEKLCRAHQLTSGTRFALVRPAAIYGPHDNFDLESCHVVPALIRKVAEKRNPLEIWGDGSELRQWTYVDDLAEGLLRATEHYAIAEPVNIATPRVSSVNGVWQALFQIEKLERDIFDPLKMVSLHTPRENLRSVVYRGDKPQAISERVVNVNRCKKFLSYECQTTLRDGLEKTLAWYRESVRDGKS